MAGVSICWQTAVENNTSSKGEHKGSVAQCLEHPGLTRKNPSTNIMLSDRTLSKFVHVMLLEYTRVAVHRMHRVHAHVVSK